MLCPLAAIAFRSSVSITAVTAFQVVEELPLPITG
jgi:hypothetical protein